MVSGIPAFSCGCMDEKVCMLCEHCAQHCKCGEIAVFQDPWPLVLAETLCNLAAMGVRL